MKGRSVDEIARVRRVNERFAARYDRSVRFWELVLGLDDGRRWIASQAEGDVLEVGIGTGRKLPYYPKNVRVTGIDLSPAMLEVARRRARDLGGDVTLRVGNAEALDLADDGFDTVVFTLALCSIPTTVEPWAKPIVCSGSEESSSYSNTSAVRSRSSGTANDCLSRCPCGSRLITCSETHSATSKVSASRHKESGAHGGGS